MLCYSLLSSSSLVMVCCIICHLNGILPFDTLNIWFAAHVLVSLVAILICVKIVKDILQLSQMLTWYLRRNSESDRLFLTLFVCLCLYSALIWTALWTLSMASVLLCIGELADIVIANFGTLWRCQITMLYIPLVDYLWKPLSRHKLNIIREFRMC